MGNTEKKDKEAAEALEEWTFLAISGPISFGCKPLSEMWHSPASQERNETAKKREKKHDE